MSRRAGLLAVLWMLVAVAAGGIWVSQGSALDSTRVTVSSLSGASSTGAASMATYGYDSLTASTSPLPTTHTDAKHAQRPRRQDTPGLL